MKDAKDIIDDLNDLWEREALRKRKVKQPAKSPSIPLKTIRSAVKKAKENRE